MQEQVGCKGHATLSLSCSPSDQPGGALAQAGNVGMRCMHARAQAVRLRRACMAPRHGKHARATHGCNSCSRVRTHACKHACMHACMHTCKRDAVPSLLIWWCRPRPPPQQQPWIGRCRQPSTARAASRPKHSMGRGRWVRVRMHLAGSGSWWLEHTRTHARITHLHACTHMRCRLVRVGRPPSCQWQAGASWARGRATSSPLAQRGLGE